MYKILIVEDNSIITDFLINVISELYPKWSVYNADSYKKAIDIAMNQDIDLFILDYELNKDNLTENGFNLGIELKNIPKYKNTPMVLKQVTQIIFFYYKWTSLYLLFDKTVWESRYTAYA